MIEREKDPQIEKLAGDVFSKMAEIGKPYDKKEELPEYNIITPEAALKELLELEKEANQTSDNT